MSSASARSPARSGNWRARFHAACASSNSSSAGACRRWPATASRTERAARSSKASAAIADASMTLSGIPGFSDDVDGPRSALRQLQALDAAVHLVDAQRRRLVGRALDDVEQLALERALVVRRAIAQPLDDPVGHVLDREADRHDGSIIAPLWNHSR